VGVGPLKYLLDTHAWLWFVEGSDRIPDAVVRRLDAEGAELYVSAMSAFEVALLAERGRIHLSDPADAWVETSILRAGLREVPVDRQIALSSRRLSVATEDPIDRFIAATAVVHGLTLVTADAALRDVVGADVLPFDGRGPRGRGRGRS
jgi:PIN domain nuclease of toxin-antitoxin system